MTDTTTDPLRGLKLLARAVRRGAEAQADTHRRAVAWAAATEHGYLPDDADEAMVWRYGLDAVAECGPDERAVLVRASILLANGATPADVCAALGAWARRFPDLVGSAPRVHVITPHGSRAEPTGWHRVLGRHDPQPIDLGWLSLPGAW